MKKTVILLTLLVAVAAGLTCVWAAEYTKFSSKFVKNFKDCDAYQETTTEKFLAGEMVFVNIRKQFLLQMESTS